MAVLFTDDGGARLLEFMAGQTAETAAVRPSLAMWIVASSLTRTRRVPKRQQCCDKCDVVGVANVVEWTAAVLQAQAWQSA